MFRTFRWLRGAARAASVVVLVCIASVASAQGLYYKEIVKDGRIYVFNIAANAERFEKGGGEMGVAITRPGAGPNGETVIGDNERALQLFFFKHGISEAVPDPPPPPLPAQPASPFKISGLVFGDYYYLQSPLANFNQQHGFWLRRAYFTYDHTFSPTVTTRLRLEANSNGKMAGGSIVPYIKDAYVKWTFHGRQALTLGIQPSLTFDFIEGVWGLRHIEKTPLDLYRMDSSRDTGLTLAGPLNATQTVKYALQFGNESGNNSETDRFKGYRAAARFEKNPGVSVEGMVGFFNRNGDADRTTAQIFLGFRQPQWRAGLQYSFQKRKIANGAGPDIDLDVISAFAVVDVRRQKWTLFARVDRFNDPCSDCSGIDYLPIDTKEPFTLTIAGLEYYVIPALRFSPNVEYVAYGNPPAGVAKPVRNTAAVRMTFYWVW